MISKPQDLGSTFPWTHAESASQASSQLVTQALRIRRSAKVLELLQRWGEKVVKTSEQ